MAQPNIDFIILDTHNRKTIAVGDTSFYPTGFSILNPTYEITPPSFVKKNIQFSPSGFMLLNSNDLEITCDAEECNLSDLPDGIWTIKASISPANKYFKEKTFIRVDNLKTKFAKAFLTAELGMCHPTLQARDKEILDEANFYIEGAIAEANKCNNKMAMEYYDEANKILDNYIKSKC